MNKILKKSYSVISQSYSNIGLLFQRLCTRKPLNSVKNLVRGKGNVISYENTSLSSVVLDVSGNRNRIEIMAGSVLNNVLFRIRGDGHKIVIGKGCRFNRGGVIWIEDSDCELTIGEKSTFEDVHLAVTEPNSKLSIGRDCMFAYDIDVRTGDSHSIISRKSNERLNSGKDVTIGNHVWVAAHCVILKGVVISDDSVVATGSVVTKGYISQGIIIAGNPAKQVKDGITWSRERINEKR